MHRSTWNNSEYVLTQEGEIVPVDEVPIYGEAGPSTSLTEHVQLIVWIR